MSIAPKNVCASCLTPLVLGIGVLAGLAAEYGDLAAIRQEGTA